MIRETQRSEKDSKNESSDVTDFFDFDDGVLEDGIDNAEWWI